MTKNDSLPESSPITPDDISWLYRTFLKREPESPAVVEYYLSSFYNIRSLIELFFNSDECQHKLRIPLGSSQDDGFVYSDSAADQPHVRQILSLLSPHQCLDYSKIRLGKNNDGGYIMINDFENIQGAYSLGINNDVSWDLDLVERINGLIYQYDHTIERLPLSHERFVWRRLGIAAIKTEGYTTLSHELRSDGHQLSKSALLLKCDIEGCEYAMLADMTPDTLLPFKQIVMELHAFPQMLSGQQRRNTHKAIKTLTQNHCVVHVHANNNSAYSLVAGIPLPTAIELTLVRRDSYSLAPSTELFPTPLDQPCSPERADFHLGTFRFA